MKTDVFVCSKPLQYLNAKNIPHNSNHKRVLVIMPQFHEGVDFINKVRKYDMDWDVVVCAKTVLDSYKYIFVHHVDNLYMGFDNGTVLGAIIVLKRINFFFFEEGNGMYVEYPYIKSKFKYFIDSLLGVSKYVGHSKYIKEAFVYEVERYKKARSVSYPVRSFEIPILDAIDKYSDLFTLISSDSPIDYMNIVNSNILLYLTEWSVNPLIMSDIKDMKQNYDFVFIKPHPHILDFQCDIDNVKIIRSNIMVEFILSRWLKGNNTISIIHSGTSALEYYPEGTFNSIFYKSLDREA